MTESIRFQLDFPRVLELLSSRIYDSPYAMLRENMQNAYDAVLMRKIRAPGSFDPLITVTVTDHQVNVKDNGVGMTPLEIGNNFWRAGASGKNTDEARSAGVVGTFGIGALANFGICQRLTVETESMAGGERTISRADRDSLSTERKSITVEKFQPIGLPGTSITGDLDSNNRIDVSGAISYLQPFIRHLPIPVKINGISVSMKPLEEAYPSDSSRWSRNVRDCSAYGWACDIEIRILENGIVWLNIKNIKFGGTPLEGQAVLKQGVGQVMAYHSGFGLARTGVSSVYSFGGVADMKILQPTAGRDALTIQSIQTLQSMVTAVEDMIGPVVAETEYVDLSTPFMTWAAKRKRWDLCGKLNATVTPSHKKLTLRDVSELSKRTHVNSYDGYDEAVVKAYASEDTPLIRISHSNPRAKCEEEYLAHYGNVGKVSNEPHIIGVRPTSSWTTAESALAFRLAETLETDYFVSATIQYGSISHNLPLLFKEDPKTPVLTLSSQNASIGMLLQCYQSDLSAFGPFVKDFTRNIVYPKIVNLVPSSTREGAEGFLKMLRRQRDTFEYDMNDMRRMEEVIAGFSKGKLSFTEVVNRTLATAHKQQQVVSARDMQPVLSVIPDVFEYQRVLQKEEAKPSENIFTPFSPKPAIVRSDVETNAKLLMLDESQFSYGFKGLLRLSERAYSDKAEFFLQPHGTEVIWGGQRIIFIFKHVSGAFAFYYDVLLDELLSIPSGGKTFETLTIVLKNSVFIPIPSNLYQYFTPIENEKKRFDVRYDILYPD